MKFLWRALLSLLLLMPAVLLFCLLTERGNRLVLESAHHLAPLHIEYAGGSLREQLHLRRIRYAAAGVEVALDDVLVVLEPLCVWRSVICFRKLQVGHLDINMIPAPADGPREQDTPPDNPAAALIVFPVAMEAESLLIGSTRIRWQGGQWLQDAAEMSIGINESSVDVFTATLTDTRLQLLDSTAESAAQQVVMPHVDLPLALSLDEVTIVRPTLELRDGEYVLESLRLQGHWLNSQVQLSRLYADDRDLGKLSLSGALELTADWPMHASLQVHLAKPPLSPWLHDRDIEASVGGDLTSLDVQLSSPGIPAVDASVRVNALDPLLPFSAMLSVTGLNEQVIQEFEGLPAFLTDIKLDAPLSLSATGSLSTQHLQLRSTANGLGYQQLQVSLSARHDAGHIVIENASLIDAAGNNQLVAAGEVDLSNGLQWSLALSSTGLSLPQIDEYLYGRLAGSLHTQGAVRRDGWQAEILNTDLVGEINGLPARIKGFAGLEDGLLLSRSELDAELNGSLLTLSNAGESYGAGVLAMEVADIGRWLPGSRGQFQARATLAASGQPYELSGTLQGFLWRDVAIDNGTITGRYQPLAEDSFHLDTTLTDIRLGSFDLTSLQLMAKGDASRQVATLESQGDLQGQLALSGKMRDQQWQGFLAPARLDTRLGIWELSEGVPLTWSGSEKHLMMTGHCWQQQDMRLCPGDWQIGREGGGNLEISGDLALLDDLLPQTMKLQGKVQFRAEAHWTADENITLEGRASTGVLALSQAFGEGESAQARWDQVNAGFTYGQNGLGLDVVVDSEGQSALELDLSLPPDRADTIAGALHLNGLKLATLAPFLPGLSHLEGELNGRLSLAGTADKPQATGRLTLSGGHLALASNPTEIDKLELTLDADGDRAQLMGDGTLGGGVLRLAGSLETIPELRLQLSVEGQKQTVLYPPSADLNLSENLRISVQKNHIEIAGDITVHEGTLEFEQLPEGSVALSADVVEVDYAGNVMREEMPFDVTMDVRVQIKDKFKLTGTLLQTALAGDLQLRQQPRKPLQVFGSLNTVGGEIRAYQQHLLIRRGVFSFAGPPDNPTVDIRADRPINGSNVTVGIQVQGQLAGDLQLDIYSDPLMSQGNAISYLVRGRSLDAGASGDGTAMALSLAGGVVNRSELVSRLNSVPGVSEVSFGAEGSENDTTATVSGYVGQRIYLSYGFGIYEPINVLTARLYLRTRLWLEVVSRLENSLDLYYSFDIN